MGSERARARCIAGLGSIITLFSLMVAVHSAQTVPTTTLSAHWPFDTVVTTTTADVAGVDNVATLIGSPPSTPAMFGNGLQFASASSRRLTVADHAELGIAATDSFTVGVWIKPSGTGTMRVMNKWNGTYGFHLDINTAAGGGASAGRVRLRVKDNASHDHDYVVDGALGNNAWKHIAGVYDRTSALKRAQIYVNGVPIGAARDITNLTGTLVNTALLEIGALAGAAPFFNGVMDEPVLYRRALTAAEIQQLAAIPQGVTATTGVASQVGRVTLTWTTTGANSYNILRGAAAAGPFTQIANVTGATTTYNDNVAAGTYYYVIQSVFTGGGTPYTSTNSAVVTGTSLPPPVTALPNTGLQTNENGATTNFTIRYNAGAAGGSVLTVSSSAITEGVVSTTFAGATLTATGFQINVAANATPTIPVTVTGIDDVFADGATPFTITVAASGFTALTIPPVQVTNNDNDTPGVTISRTSGLVTTEAGGQDSFTVVLNTRPYGNITMPLSSTLTSEGTLSATAVTFTTANWNTAQQVTLTGVDDTILDFSVPYTIVTGPLTTTTADQAAYGGMNPTDIQAANVDDEVIPPAPEAWGSGGCGLLGLEATLAVALALLARRRRRLE